MKKVRRPTVREGYDLWAETYDRTPNPIVAMDARHTLPLLAPAGGERVLDAGCGTGRNLAGIRRAGGAAVGLDFSFGMLRVARRRHPRVPLLQADLQAPFPFQPRCFDAVLCALIGEHLSDLTAVFRETGRVMKDDGRFLFSVYHPELAAAGKEANFQREDVEYRLGAFRYSVDDYRNRLAEAGFKRITTHEFYGDEELAKAIPAATKYLHSPLLLILEARP